MINSIQKKVNIREVYKEILESSDVELDRLRPCIILEVKNYV